MSAISVDDDALLDNPPVANPGTVKLVVFRVNAHSTRASRHRWYSNTEISNVIHERSKKAGSHMTRCGRVMGLLLRACAETNVNRFGDAEGGHVKRHEEECEKLDDHPCATFILNYRPRGAFFVVWGEIEVVSDVSPVAVLQAEGFIPNDLPSNEDEEDRKPEIIDISDDEEALAEISELEASTQRGPSSWPLTRVLPGTTQDAQV